MSERWVKATEVASANEVTIWVNMTAILRIERTEGRSDIRVPLSRADAPTTILQTVGGHMIFVDEMPEHFMPPA